MADIGTVNPFDKRTPTVCVGCAKLLFKKKWLYCLGKKIWFKTNKHASCFYYSKKLTKKEEEFKDEGNFGSPTGKK